LWILLGIVLSAIGILICLFAGPRHDFFLYMTGIALWRLGESLNDVTTEAIVPDLVPAKQFGIASAIKAASFVAGGLFGYIALYFMADVHYTWCYYAYLGCMFITAIPSLMLLNKDLPCKPNKYREGNTFGENMSQAYITPTYMKVVFLKSPWRFS
jgi:MFS family permease